MTAAIIGPDLLILGFVLPIALAVWCAVDALARPTSAWQRSGHNKTTWVVVDALAVVLALWSFVIIFATVAALAIAAAYLLAVRPSLRTSERVL